MSDRNKARLTLLMLACSTLALIATSPPPLESKGSATGEAVVGPGQPTSIDVRFEVGPYVTETPRATVDVLVPEGRLDARVQTQPLIRVDGNVVARTSTAWELPTAFCTDGCVVEVHVDLTWVGQPEADLHLLWRIQTTFEHETIPIRTTSTSPPRPPLAPIHLFGLGLAAALLSGFAWLRAGLRFRRIRLGIIAVAGVALLVESLPWIASLQFFDIELLWFRPEYVIWPLAVVVLLGLLAFAVIRHHRGRGLALGVAGWLGLIAVGGYVATVADETTAYRPLEMLLLGIAVGVPASTAITSPPLVQSGRRVSQGEVLLVASQVVLIILAAVATATIVPQLASEMLRGRLEDVGLSLCVIGELVLLVWGYRRWRRGAAWMLVLANLLAVLPLGLLAIVFLSTGTGFLSVSTSTQVLGLVPAAAALAGLIGGLVVRPPGAGGVPATPTSGTPADAIEAQQDGHEERRQDEEVAGISGEHDPAWLRNRLAEQRRAGGGEGPLGEPQEGPVGVGGGAEGLDGDEPQPDGHGGDDNEHG